MTGDRPRPIRVLVVDDSAFMCAALTQILQKDPQILVSGTANDGVECIAHVMKDRPDVITLDVEMPNLNGLSTLKALMRMDEPIPVLMVSALTQEGAETTLRALELGAVDFIPKSSYRASMHIYDTAAELTEKIKAIARKRYVPPKPSENQPVLPRPPQPVSVQAIVLGTSTGGPRALHSFLPRLPKDLPVGIAIVQHMPPNFTKSLAKRLDETCALSVGQASAGQKLLPGVALLIPGGSHAELVPDPDGGLAIRLLPGDAIRSFYTPSVDHLFSSAARHAKGVLGIVLSGVGKDGLEGARRIKQSARNRMLVQDERSCLVYGMPKAIVEAGLADRIVGIEQMADAILETITTPPLSPGDDA